MEDAISRYTMGRHETEVFEDGKEGNYIERYGECKKSLGHDAYISLAEFKTEHLPDPYKDDAITSLVKVMAGLTVMIEILGTSKDRPKVYQGTSDEYPFSNGCVGVRTGTGRVEDVKSMVNKPGEETSWEVKIFTATHVVFDDFEAKRARCRLKFDADNSKARKADRLTGIEVTEADVPGDWCCFKCVTHDADLANELLDLLDQCTKICKQLSERYKRIEKDALTIIVGHPHGGPKKVSVGVSTSRREITWPDETKYTYTTTTCAGSSGSWVYILGRAASCRLSYHVHSGYNNDGNYCSVGWDF